MEGEFVKEAGIGYEHLHRYAYATQFVQKKRVLDLACGEGYGSYLLARTAECVVGIDIDADAIRRASSTYLKRNLEFKVGSITAVPLEGENLFDVIVCYEALEHVEDHEKLLKEVKRLLVPDGLFIVSTRNKRITSDQPQYKNPSHVHEFDFQQFRALLDTYFEQVKFLGQRIYCNSSIWPLHSKDNHSLVEYVIERGPKEFLFVEEDKKCPTYFVALASDGGQAIDDKNCLLTDVSNELLEQQARLVSEQQGLLQRIVELEATVQHQQETLIKSEGQQRQLEAERGELIQGAGELSATVQAQRQALFEKDEQIAHQEHLSAEKNRQVSKLLARMNSAQEGQSTLRSNTVAPSPGSDRHISLLFSRQVGFSSEYVPISTDHVNLAGTDVRVIAFYLPQFHPVEENDRWWGKGFTEWTQVSKALPQFVGHYQPHLPGELGFYDLRLVDVQRRQIELARKYGIYGFCFYYYWFNGKRLLERPLDQFLKNPDLDFPFCLCWANESWTRRWDGLENEVLMPQTYASEDDFEFIKSVEEVLRDKRYIKINGRPLLVVYKPGALPDSLATLARWRDYCLQAGVGNPYVVGAQTFGTTDPRPFGLDAAVEFPPHNLKLNAPVLNSQLDIINPQYQGEVYDYAYMIEAARKVVASEYTLFRGLFPSWDNEPRRPGGGHTFMNSSPDLYQEWLSYACAFAAQNPDPDKRIVFINAWNEWGEGCHLEPDRRFGYAYLQATADVLRGFRNGKTHNGPEIVFVSHDANRAGAQKLLLTLIRWIQNTTDIQPKVILRQGGVLTREFRRLAPVLEAETLLRRGRDALSAALLRFCGDSASLIYINTLVPGDIAEILAQLRIPIITHVHELEHAIERWCPKNQLEKILRLTDHFIAASPPVAENLSRRHGVASARITTINAFIDCSHATGSLADRKTIRKEKGLREKGLSVFGCGTTDWRKGPDLFIEVARRVIAAGSRDVQFYWIGGSTEISERDKLDAKIHDLNLEDYVSFLGEVPEPREYFLAGDLFLLTSREDPFPLVALEAADCGLPVVCFDRAGAMPGFVQGDAGYVIAFEDVQAMAEKVVFLGDHSEERLRMGGVAQQRVKERHDVSIAGQRILETINQFAVKEGRVTLDDSKSQRPQVSSVPRVSVIVPNYNHALYIRQRLDSILQQEFQDLEVIILDDASTDNSREIIESYAHYPNFRFLFNDTRSGSAFKQWKQGLESARGEYVWFAESDDYASPDFLSKLLPILEEDRRLGLVYCQSYLVDPDNRVLGDALQWTDDLDSHRWRSDFVNDGRAEIKSYLSKKNTIPNASAVLIRASTLKSIDYLDDTYSLCGDWLLWIKLLLRSNVGYAAEKLNYWRQQSSNSRPHPPGVTEWKEGQQIIRYVAEELGLPEAERDRMLLNFLDRCFEWITTYSVGAQKSEAT
jgi:glycosyltransferase involved in cell wall biosynthesis/ubiquinone/menaquinone biosynthesis C-methylase UbiE